MLGRKGKGKKTKQNRKAFEGLSLAAQVERVGKGEEETRERGGAAKTRRGAGAAQGRMLALRETWWCRDDIFRAAARVIDEYQMLSITPWEKLMKEKKSIAQQQRIM